MKNYNYEIINEFLNKYENSSYYKGISDKKRKITLDLNKLFHEYGRSDCFDETEAIEKSIEFLLKEKFVTLGNKNEYGHKSIVLNQNDTVIDRIYSFARRKKLNNERELFLEKLNFLLSLTSNVFITDFLNELIYRTLEYKSLSPYMEANSLKELDDVYNILVYMSEQKEEISFRKFSIIALNDSKKLELYKNKIFHIIKDFCDENIEKSDDAFELFNIMKNPSYIYIKGNMIIQINNQIIDLKETNYDFAISSHCLTSLKILNIDASCVMTVENLTSFYDTNITNALLIYLGGFHNTIRRSFLLKIYQYFKEDTTYYHFGDIDAGGFYIYLDLITKTHIPFVPYKMDINTLIEYKDNTKELTKSDRTRLTNIKQIYDNEVIDYMLEHNVKLEQEIITVTDLI